MLDIAKHAENFKKALELINQSKRIILITHKNPDADGIGSMLAVAHFLERIKKNYVLFSNDRVPQNLLFLSKFNEITDTLPAHGSFDLMMAFDYGQLNRLCADKIMADNKDIKIISFDHHAFIDQRGNVNLIDTDFSSTTHIVYSFLKFNNIEIDKNIGTCLLAGLFTDTSELKNSRTTAFVLEIFKEILENKDVDYNLIIENILKKKRLAVLKAAGICLGRVAKDKETDMIVSFMTEDDVEDLGVTFNELDNMVDILNESSDGRLTILVKENKSGIVDVSLRSDEKKGIDVLRIASEIGGGGHKYASGFQVKGSIEEVFDNLKKVVKRHI